MADTAHVDTFARDNLPPQDQWPAFLFTRPELQYPERLNCAVAFLDRWVNEGRGDEPCLISPAETLTYRELQDRVNRICNVLVHKLGFVPGNRVLLRSANNPMMVAAYLAVLKAGGVVVATMPLLRAREIAYPLTKAKITIAFCDYRLAEELERARAMAPDLRQVVYWGSGKPNSLETLIAEASPEFAAVDTAADDVCLIGFTSGTTG
jgi:2-aminobenzoate-CoA ligase